MKKITLAILIAGFLASCGGSSTLETKKKELEEKREELREVKEAIKTLEIEIAKMDTTVKEHFIPVTIETVSAKRFRNPVKIQGLVESDKDVTVAAELGGKVLRILVKEGQNVRAGQTIATLDGSSVAGQVGELKAALDLAETNYEKQERLWNQGIGSEMQYLQAKNQVERLKNSLSAAQSQLGKFNMTSPITGVVDQIFANEGEVLSPGMGRVARIVNTNDIKIRANVSESYLGKIKLGEDVIVKYPSLDLQFEEKVGALGSYINPDNRTFGMTIYPDHKNTNMKPNLLAIITAYDYEKDSAITAPTKLIRNDGEGDYILGLRKDEAGIDRVVKIPIEVEKSFTGRSVIKSGLKEGDRIITEGYDNVIGGDAVKIIED